MADKISKVTDEHAVIPMTVQQVILDPRNQTPIVILVNEEEKLCLPIWIGPYEATSIITALEEIDLPRPMTHDLMIETLTALGSHIEYVVIHEMKNDTFFAEIVIQRDGKRVSVDARPSDSIALALRAEAPILAERAVCDAMARVETFMEEAAAEQYKTFLENLDPGDISKYKM